MALEYYVVEYFRVNVNDLDESARAEQNTSVSGGKNMTTIILLSFTVRYYD